MHRSRNEMSGSALREALVAFLQKNATAASPCRRSRYANGLFWSNPFLESWRSPILGAINHELRDFEYHQ
jgi:hypothetical protein